MDPEETAHRLLEIGSAHAHEAQGKRGAVGPLIRPAWKGARLAGPCRTVQIDPGDNLGVHVALDEAAPGEVLVTTSPSGYAFGIWGELTTTYAIKRGVAGLVTPLGVRDVAAIAAARFPVFAGSHAVLGTVKNSPGRQQVPVRLGHAFVAPGDWIVCDEDCCTVVRASRLAETIEKAARRQATEQDALKAVQAGESTRSALKLQ